mgnify:CR=1 FL=1
MAGDYAKTRKTAGGNPRRGAPPNKSKKGRAKSSKAAPAERQGSAWRAYLAGLISGVFIRFMLYLANMPAGDRPEPGPEPAASAVVPAEPPKPRFDFYTMLPLQTIDGPFEPADVAEPPGGAKPDVYLLQAGSFRQREDADRRRAELLLLGLEPRVEETTGDNGRWFRVYLGPFEARSEVARARSLTAAQDIDTLLLKRGNP